MKYIVEPKSRGFDVVDTTAVPRADGFWCFCVDIERAQVIAKLLNDRDGVELLNRHAEELNAEGEDSATFQSWSDEHVPPESLDPDRAAYVVSFEKEATRAARSEEQASPDFSHRPPWEELRALGGRARITANESVWSDEEDGPGAPVRKLIREEPFATGADVLADAPQRMGDRRLLCLGGISAEQLNASGDFHEPLEDDDLLAP